MTCKEPCVCKEVWKSFNPLPNETNSYLVSWMREDRTFSEPHRAYWVASEERFFSSECGDLGFPLYVDIWTEIPKLPK